MTQKEFVELCADGDYWSVKGAIESGIDPNEPAIINGISVGAMFVAASSGNCHAVRALLEHGAGSAEGYVAAVIGRKMEIVRFLYRRHEDINALDSGGTNALITATTMKRPEIVEELLYYEADPNVKSQAGHTALTYLAMIAANEKKQNPEEYHVEGDIEKIASLLLEYDADYLEAMMIAIKTDLFDFVLVLVNRKKNLNLQDEDGRSLVMLSVMNGGGMILDYMLDFGADPDLPDNKGRTPLMIAAIDEEADHRIINSLLRAGADIDAHDNRGITPLMWAVVGADKTPGELLPALIRTGGVRASGWEKWFAFLSLYNAAKRGLQLDMVSRLINEGADVNAVDNRGMNAMMYALLEGDDEVADILAEAGAKINFDMN